MVKSAKTFRPKAANPRGLVDISGDSLRAANAMFAAVASVFEIHGFEPLATPALEFSDALGKFLPDEDRPNAGVFSLQDDDERWMSLRYDLTAPLARFVAQNYDALPKPFRRYQMGPVWRNEKPGPGRTREFLQIDADTVGAQGVAADAEMAMLAADCLEAIGIDRGDYVIKVNNRKLMDGVLEKLNLAGEDDDANRQRLIVMRAIDKLDRLGTEGVALLLGPGRKDSSGDFTKGAGLADTQIATVMDFVGAGGGARDQVLTRLEAAISGTMAGDEGLGELSQIDTLIKSAGYGPDRICFDPSVVRGLEYYTGPVLEAELTFTTEDETGVATRFGSVGGGGRYDGLVTRFRGQDVPATGFSIGVSRLGAALEYLGRHKHAKTPGPVVVLVMDKDQLPAYQAMARELRAAGIRAEMYMGASGMRAQMKYADKRHAPAVVIEGEDERGLGEVTIKDLALGAALSREIDDNREWRQSQQAQVNVPRAEMVAQVKKVLDRGGPGPSGAG